MSFEQSLQQNMMSVNSEKTFIDKLLAKEDVDKIRELIKKPKLERKDMLELLYLLSGTEAKLLNYGEWDRYIILKFFVWIREFVKIAELLYDYRDDLDRKERTCRWCNKLREDCGCKYFVPVIKLNKRTRKLFENNERLIEHNAKFLIDLYFNIGRTTLSLGGSGFMEMLKNKYEIAYPNNPVMNTPVVTQEKKGGLFSLRK